MVPRPAQSVTSRRGSLVVVGTGITLIQQATPAAVATMKRAEKLHYLVADTATEEWIRRLNETATSLDDCYAAGKARIQSYGEMTDRIMSGVRAGLHVCAAFYGHPGVLVRPAHEAVRSARNEGYPTTMLPGVSAEDCLFADLSVDPGERGCQTFDATDFLAYRRRFDPSSALVLWQVGALGESSTRSAMTCRPERLRVLIAALRSHYPADHPVVLYQAAQFPTCKPVIRRTSLEGLAGETVPASMTLYVPPVAQRDPDSQIIAWLEEQAPA